MSIFQHAGSSSTESEEYVKSPDRAIKQVLSSVLEEHEVIAAQKEKRQALLKSLEKKAPQGTKAAYISFFCSEAANASIDSGDIPALADVLMSVGDVDELNLIISGPGGDGTIAEKMIELCRAYCRRFRVIVPNRAKSAATIIALGADEIVMGHCSELGPIDAQVLVVVGGLLHYVSAQSFIDARTTLEDRFAEAIKDGKDPRPILQQIAGLDSPFIDHCEKLMDFSRAAASKYLGKHMFSGIKPKTKRDQAISNVLTKLTSVRTFKVHGRMIDGNAAKTELNLNVSLLGKDDPTWSAVWEYYTRADVALATMGLAKMVESKSETLTIRKRSE